jgi:site-specific recombinase XerC
MRPFDPIDRDKYWPNAPLCHVYRWLREHEDSPQWTDPCFLVRLVLGGGLRVSEIPAIDISRDCDPVGWIVVRKGKGSKRRDVRLTPECTPYFRERLERLGSGLLFPTESGKPLSRRTLQRWWDRVVGKVWWASGRTIPRLSIHGGRHTYASWELALGQLKWGSRLSLEVLSANLGHSSIQITQGYYIHTVRETVYCSEPPAWPRVALGKFYQPMHKECPVCGAEVTTEDRHCRECGALQRRLEVVK